MFELNNKGLIRLTQIDDDNTQVFELTNLDKLFEVNVEPKKGFQTPSSLKIKIIMVPPIYENRKYWQRLFSRTRLFTHDLKYVDYVTYIKNTEYIFRLDLNSNNKIESIFGRNVGEDNA